MDESNNIEDKLRDQLNSREFNIKNSWQADMDSKLDVFNSKNKKGIVFLGIGLTLLICISGLSYYFLDQEDLSSNYVSREGIHSPLSVDTSATDWNNYRESRANGASISEEVDDIRNSNTELDSSSDHATIKDNITLSENSNTEKKANGKDGIVNNETETITHDSNDYISNSNISNDSSIQSEYQNASQSHIKSHKSTNGTEKSTPLYSPNNNEKRSTDELQTSPKDLYLKDDFRETQINSHSAQNISEQLPLDRVINEKLFKLIRKKGVLPISEQGYSLKNDVSFSPFNSIVKRNNNWELSLLAGVSSSKLNENEFKGSLKEYDGKLDLQPLKSSQIDLRLTRNISPRLGIQSGLSKTTFGEELDFSDFTKLSEDSFYQYSDILQWVVDSIFQGDSLVSIDSTQTLVIDSMLITTVDSSFIEVPGQVNGKKSHTFLQIPIGFRYKISTGLKSAVLLEPELSVGILLSNQGLYYDESSREPRVRSMVLSASLGIGYSYDFTEKLYAKTLVRFRSTIGSLGNDDGLIRKYNQYNIQLGLGYKF